MIATGYGSLLLNRECVSSYDAYYKAAQEFTIAQATLATKETAAAEIDRVLTDCIVTVRSCAC